MATSPVTVTVRLDGMRRFRRVLSNRGGEIKKAFTEWTRIYARFISKRFTQYSRGGGNWARLKPATIAAKKRAGYTRPKRILYATGKMRRELNIYIRGNVGIRSTKIPHGIKVSYGSNNRYPKKTGQGPTVRQVMHWHNTGAGNLPKRQIIVKPDLATRRKMADVMNKAMVKQIEKDMG